MSSVDAHPSLLYIDADEMGRIDLFEARFLPARESEGSSPRNEIPGGWARKKVAIHPSSLESDNISVFASGGRRCRRL